MRVYKQTFQIILSSIIVLACGHSKTPNDTSDYVLDSTRIVVLAYDTTLYEPLARLELQSVFQAGTKFELTPDDFKTIDSVLTDCINEINVMQGEEFERYKNSDWFKGIKKEDMMVKIEDYKRQYVPVILGTGQKEVFVNCFPYKSSDIDHWKNQLLFSLGGGAKHFTVYINLTTNQYRNLRINAPM